MGPLMDEATVSILMEGLDPSQSGFLQSALRHQKPTFTNILQEAELVYSSVNTPGRRYGDRENSNATRQGRTKVAMNASFGLQIYPRMMREKTAVLTLDYERHSNWYWPDPVETGPCDMDEVLPKWNDVSTNDDMEHVFCKPVPPPV
jgi:hypothetical protein